MNECTLPLKRDVEMGARLVVKQSASWSWTHRPEDEHRLSRAARTRLALLRWHAAHGQNVSCTCRHFGISRPTFYRWRNRYRLRGVRGLEDSSHRPHAVRCSTWSLHEIQAVLRLRLQYPRWGKAKLQVLLAGEHISLSCSMIGRMLRRLKHSGQLRAGKRKGIRSVSRPRPYAIRKPKDYPVAAAGDLIQLDIKDLRFGNGSTFKHLSLVDVTSRYATAEVGVGTTATTITTYLDRMRARLPFQVRAIQVDGGSEFKGHFEVYCRDHGLRLFVLPPRSPKLNAITEAFFPTLECELLARSTFRTHTQARTAIFAYIEGFYNTHRRHSAL